MKRLLVFLLVLAVGFQLSSGTVSAKEVTLPAISVPWFNGTTVDLSTFDIPGAKALFTAQSTTYPYYVVCMSNGCMNLYLSTSPLFMKKTTNVSGTSFWELWIKTDSSVLQYYWQTYSNPGSWKMSGAGPYSYAIGHNEQVARLYLDTIKDSDSSMVYFNNTALEAYDGDSTTVSTFTFEHYLNYGYDRDHAGATTPDDDKEDDNKAWYEYLLDIPAAIWDLFKGGFDMLLVPLKAIASFVARLDEILTM